MYIYVCVCWQSVEYRERRNDLSRCTIAIAMITALLSSVTNKNNEFTYNNVNGNILYYEIYFYLICEEFLSFM